MSTIEKIRKERNYKLLVSDRHMLYDSLKTEQQKQDWATYRQALRDLPNRPDLDLNNPQWPEEPS